MKCIVCPTTQGQYAVNICNDLYGRFIFLVMMKNTLSEM